MRGSLQLPLPCSATRHAFGNRTGQETLITSPRIVPRAEHNISRKQISDNALKVLYRLKKGGYEAYVVGGGVRDILLGDEPKDFDIATNASPEQVRDLFRNCRLIGRRFRLAHILFGPEIIEVATFRANVPEQEDPDDEDRDVHDSGLILRDNVYGSMEEDAFRRDFTVNALYYNIRDFSVVDYVGGMDDIHARRLRLIGDPEERYREDPVRMLRAVRFAVKLGFEIDPATAEPIPQLAERLEDIPAARLFDEFLKLFLGGRARDNFERLRELGLFERLFPQTEAALAGEHAGTYLAFLRAALESTDTRIAADKPVTPAFLLAAFFWGPISDQVRWLEEEGNNYAEALQIATSLVIDRQQARVAVPRRFQVVIRDMVHLQRRLNKRHGKRAMRLLGHPRFRAAYDFLVLRARAGEAPEDLADWWTRVQEMDEAERKQAFLGNAPGGGKPGGRRRGGRRRGRGKEGNHG